MLEKEERNNERGRLNQASGEILNFTDHLDIYHSKRVHVFNVAVMFMNLFHIKMKMKMKQKKCVSKYIFNNLFMLSAYAVVVYIILKRNSKLNISCIHLIYKFNIQILSLLITVGLYE